MCPEIYFPIGEGTDVFCPSDPSDREKKNKTATSYQRNMGDKNVQKKYLPGCKHTRRPALKSVVGVLIDIIE